MQFGYLDALGLADVPDRREPSHCETKAESLPGVAESVPAGQHLPVAAMVKDNLPSQVRDAQKRGCGQDTAFRWAI